MHSRPPQAPVQVGVRALVKSIRRLRRDLRAVTPVIGSILILGITVMGIAAVMLWGAPALQRIEEQNAQGAMLGEFREVRQDSLVLSITDSSRLPRISVDQGTLALEQGSHMMVTSNHDTGDTDCDMHVDDWGVGANDDYISVTFTDCDVRLADMIVQNSGISPASAIDGIDNGVCVSPDPCFRIYEVTGAQRSSQDISVISASTSGTSTTVIMQSAADDFTAGNWLFELADAGSVTTYSEAWLIDNMALKWGLSGATTVRLHLEAGALFSGKDKTLFLEEEPPMAEEAFGSTDFVLRLPTFLGDEASNSGRQTPTMYLGLVGNHARIEAEAATLLRFDFEGEFAEAWCNTLVARTSFLDEGVYQADADYGCATGGTDERRSVTYQSLNGGTPQAFVFEFIHARIYTDL